jgi:hypothetical protein
MWPSCGAETAVLILFCFLCGPMYVLMHPVVMSRCLCFACVLL